MVPGAFLYLGGGMATKLFVGNLSFRVTAADLDTLFGRVGAVASVHFIADKFCGQPLAFGFVEMGSQAEAQARSSGSTAVSYRAVPWPSTKSSRRGPAAGVGVLLVKVERIGAVSGAGKRPGERLCLGLELW
jgi:hypothetical protein